MEKFTPLAKNLHCRRHWGHWQIPPLLGELVGRAWNICKLCLKWWWMQSASRSAPLPPPRPPLCKYLYIWILSLNIISIFETIFIFGHYPCTNVHYLYIFILEDCLLLHDNFIAPKASAEGTDLQIWTSLHFLVNWIDNNRCLLKQLYIWRTQNKWFITFTESIIYRCILVVTYKGRKAKK